MIIVHPTYLWVYFKQAYKVLTIVLPFSLEFMYHKVTNIIMYSYLIVYKKTAKEQ